jgi:hypothetical protein
MVYGSVVRVNQYILLLKTDYKEIGRELSRKSENRTVHLAV